MVKSHVRCWGPFTTFTPAQNGSGESPLWPLLQCLTVEGSSAQWGTSLRTWVQAPTPIHKNTSKLVPCTAPTLVTGSERSCQGARGRAQGLWGQEGAGTLVGADSVWDRRTRSTQNSALRGSRNHGALVSVLHTVSGVSAQAAGTPALHRAALCPTSPSCPDPHTPHSALGRAGSQSTCTY